MMQVIERVPRKYDAIQFNKEGDFPNVRRGYIQTKNNHQAVFISEAMPRSMDCQFCYVLEVGIVRHIVFVGDWILTEVRDDKVVRKIVADKKFRKKYISATLADTVKE
jgi:hypothetical protein